MLHFFAKRLNQLHEVKREERGFTLIELLVVVIIIGILAAIAIPVFLNQREKAQAATVQSDLRNAATAESSYYAENGTWASTQTQLEGQGFRKSDGVAALTINQPGTAAQGGYCIQTQYTGVASTLHHIAEKSGGVVSGGC